MKSALSALLVAVVTLAPASSARQGASNPAPAVVPLSAVDKEGRPFEGLKPEDLRVTVEGAEQRPASLARAKPGRRVVLLFTDGVDTSSRVKSDKAVERLVREGVVVYCVGFADTSSFDQVDTGALRKVSGRTGGRAVFPQKEKELPQAFEQVRRELLSSYTLGLAPAPPKAKGKPHALRVEVVNPELRKRGVELAYPQAFFDESVGAPAARP